MEKATWTLGIVIVVMILLSIIMTGKPTTVIPTAAPAKQEAPAQQQAPAQAPVTAPVK